MPTDHHAIPRIAIVGRPNVGKSSVMNMLAGAKVSIVDDMPGVTRDRVSTLVELTGPLKTEEPKVIELIDTGGYGVYTAEGARFDDAGQDLATLTGDIERQIAQAVERADMILFVIDAQTGVTALDETVAKLIRERALGAERAGRPLKVQVVANKVDSEKWEPHAFEASAFGFGEPWIVSAKTNFFRRDFTERLFEAVPEGQPEDESGEPEMKIALVGRRNAGKSTFVNALAGEERCIVSEIAGTTRDAIDVRFEMEGRSLVAIDTAGVRRRTKFHEQVEYWAFDRMNQSIARADVVLLAIDATENVGGLDKRLGAAILAQHKPCIILVTKWDLAEGRKNRQGKPIRPEDYLKYLQQELVGLSFAPIVFSSAVDSVGLNEVVQVAFDLYEQSRQRLSTSKLNDTMRDILAERGPTSKLGTQVKILYVAQVATQPPTIVLVVNHPKLFTPDYERYVLNRLRERTPFTEIPIRLILRERKRAELGDLLSGEYRARKGTAGAGTIEGVEGDIVAEERRSAAREERSRDR